MSLLLISSSQTDGDLLIEPVEVEEVAKLIETRKLHYSDYALVEGETIKGLAQKLNLKHLPTLTTGTHRMTPEGEYLLKLRSYCRSIFLDFFQTMQEDFQTPDEKKKIKRDGEEAIRQLEAADSAGDIVRIMGQILCYDAPTCMEHLLKAAEIQADLSEAPLHYDT